MVGSVCLVSVGKSSLLASGSSEIQISLHPLQLYLRRQSWQQWTNRHESVQKINFVMYVCTLADSGFFKNFLYQGGVKSTVSGVFEDLLKV